MTKQELSLARKHLRESNKLQPKTMTLVPKEQWPYTSTEIKPTLVFRSQEFFAQVFQWENSASRLSINRTEINNDGNFKADISWEELQRVKSEVGFGHLDAVEIFPKDRDVVNVGNMRHLWVMIHPLDFAWRSKSEKTATPFSPLELSGQSNNETQDTVPTPA